MSLHDRNILNMKQNTRLNKCLIHIDISNFALNPHKKSDYKFFRLKWF